MPTTAPHLWSGLASLMDPLSLNPAFVFAAGRAALCNLKQKSPCPQGLALLLHPPLAWTLQQHAEASGGGEGCAGPIAACCLPLVGDPQPVPPSWGPRRAQRLLLRSGGPWEQGPRRTSWYHWVPCPTDALVFGKAWPSGPPWPDFAAKQCLGPRSKSVEGRASRISHL